MTPEKKHYCVHFASNFTVPGINKRPNAWFRFWQWFFLGWKWTCVHIEYKREDRQSRSPISRHLMKKPAEKVNEVL